jgi:hypothetical protein
MLYSNGYGAASIYSIFAFVLAFGRISMSLRLASCLQVHQAMHSWPSIYITVAVVFLSCD